MRTASAVRRSLAFIESIKSFFRSCSSGIGLYIPHSVHERCDLPADGLAGGDSRRLDAQEVDEVRRTVAARLLDDEVAERLARALELGADAGVVGLEVIVGD